MYNFTTRDDIDLDAIRARLVKMSDADLLAYGKAAASLAKNSYQRRETWIVQLREGRAEWRRRHRTGLD